MKRKKEQHIIKISVYVLLIFWCAISLFPLIWMVSASFKSHKELFSSSIKIFPSSISLENYRFAFAAVPLMRSIFNSAFVSSSHALLVIFFSSLAGFAFAKYSFPGRNILFTFMLVTMMIPMELGLVPSFIIMKKLHWINTYYALIIPGAVYPFAIFFMRQYIATVPNALLDAARIDGCSSFRIYYRIILPIIKPALATLGIMDFLWTWKDFLWPLIMARTPEMYTLMVALNSMPSIKFATPWGAVMAACTIAVVPLIIVFVIFQKQFITGATMGAIK